RMGKRSRQRSSSASAASIAIASPVLLFGQPSVRAPRKIAAALASSLLNRSGRNALFLSELQRRGRRAAARAVIERSGRPVRLIGKVAGARSVRKGPDEPTMAVAMARVAARAALEERFIQRVRDH